MIRLALFASGGGSNAAKIMDYFAGHPHIEVALVLSNVAQAGVLQLAKEKAVPTFVVGAAIWKDAELMLSELSLYNIDWIILAGFLKLVPEYLTSAYENKILNIHPALLPKFGGKGMYGHFVHEAVFLEQEKQSGMTIHRVNNKFDDGEIVFQAATALNAEDSALDIAAKVLQLEHEYYARVIEALILGYPMPVFRVKEGPKTA